MHDQIVTTFTCAVCGYEYHSNTTDQEAEQAFFEEYGEQLSDCDEDIVSLCDWCHAEFKRRKQ